MTDNFIQLQLPIDNYGTIDTLKGVTSVATLGRVLMHEHIFCRVRPQYFDKAKEYLKDQISILTKKHSVGTIVDLTTYVLPDPYVDFLTDQPINIICCAGYYLGNKIPSTYKSQDVSYLSEKLHQKIELGIGQKKIKPGIIKVASSGRELTPFEIKVMRAAGKIQQECGLPIATHACKGGRKQLECLLDAGANPDKIFFSHMEMELKGTRPVPYEILAQDILWILSQGSYIFFGDFPYNTSPYRNQIIRLFKLCAEKGYLNKLFISTDSYWMHRHGHIQVRGSNLSATKPRTYEYTFSVITPLLLENGFSNTEIELVLRNNPQNFFLK